EEPVDALDVLFLARHAALGDAAGTGGRDDDALAGAPVGRGGDVELVGGLQGLDHAQDLVEATAGGQRVVQDRANLGLRVDDEDGAHGGGFGLARHDHAVPAGDVHGHVVDEGELHVDVLPAAEL